MRYRLERNEAGELIEIPLRRRRVSEYPGPGEAKTFSIGKGNFYKNRPRRIAGLARFPGDPEAECRSEEEVDRKLAEQGKTRVRVDDLYYDEHPVYETDEE